MEVQQGHGLENFNAVSIFGKCVELTCQESIPEAGANVNLLDWHLYSL